MAKDSHRDPRKSVPAPATYVRLLLRRFATTPELRAALLAGADIDEERLKDPAAEVTLFTYCIVSDNLCRVIGETWPLEVMAAWSTATQGALEVAVRSAPTVGDGVDILTTYGHVRGPNLGLRSKRDKANTRIILTNTAAMSEAAQRALTETAVLSGKAMLAEVLEGHAADLEFHFTWAPPKYCERMRTALGGMVKYAQPQCAIIVPSALCERPSPFADSALFATALAELDHGARRIAGADVLAVRIERLFKRRRAGRLTEEEAASELGLSRRTLVRRLAERGLSFRTLLDANLRQRAAQMLSDKKLSRDQMSEALGFEDPTSFSRACRRWFKYEDARP